MANEVKLTAGTTTAKDLDAEIKAQMAQALGPRELQDAIEMLFSVNPKAVLELVKHGTIKIGQMRPEEERMNLIQAIISTLYPGKEALVLVYEGIDDGNVDWEFKIRAGQVLRQDHVEPDPQAIANLMEELGQDMTYPRDWDYLEYWEHYLHLGGIDQVFRTLKIEMESHELVAIAESNITIEKFAQLLWQASGRPLSPSVPHFIKHIMDHVDGTFYREEKWYA